MISKVYSRNKCLWSISCHSFIIPPRGLFKILLNSSLWICSFFTIGLEGSHYFCNKLNHTSTGAYSLCKTLTIFDPLKLAPLQLVAPVSRGNILPTHVVNIHLLTSSFFFTHSHMLSTLQVTWWVTFGCCSKSGVLRAGTRGMRDQLKRWWLSLCFCFLFLLKIFSSPWPPVTALVLSKLVLISLSLNHTLYLRSTGTVLVQ